jgi:hypothetical protein
MVRTYLKKRNKPDVSEGVIEEGVGCTRKEAVPNICSFQIRNDPYSTALQN